MEWYKGWLQGTYTLYMYAFSFSDLMPNQTSSFDLNFRRVHSSSPDT